MSHVALETQDCRSLSTRFDTPCVVRGAIDGGSWPVSFDSLREDYGGLQVLVRNACDATYRMALAEYLDYVREPESFAIDDGPLYLADWYFERDMPELAAQLPSLLSDEDWFADLMVGFRPMYRWLYIGAAGSSTGLHCDSLDTHGFLVVLAGSKHWRLFHPDDMRHFEPTTDHRCLAPEGQPLRHGCVEAILGPGDGIFVPSGWWHSVENLEPSLALTCNYANASNCDRFLRAVGDDPRFSVVYELIAQRIQAALDDPQLRRRTGLERAALRRAAYTVLRRARSRCRNLEQRLKAPSARVAL